jgi:hypothetical protein
MNMYSVWILVTKRNTFNAVRISTSTIKVITPDGINIDSLIIWCDGTRCLLLKHITSTVIHYFNAQNKLKTPYVPPRIVPCSDNNVREPSTTSETNSADIRFPRFLYELSSQHCTIRSCEISVTLINITSNNCTVAVLTLHRNKHKATILFQFIWPQWKLCIYDDLITIHLEDFTLNGTSTVLVFLNFANI